jgi:hypothetical protein
MQSKKKALTVFVLAMLVLSMLSAAVQFSSAQVMAISIDPPSGPVGTTVTVTGTIETYDGEYYILFDMDGDGSLEDGEELVLETTGTIVGKAVGYTVEDKITVPDTYSGAKLVGLKDKFTDSVADTPFTVERTWELEVDPASNYEGGSFDLTATIRGGERGWVSVVVGADPELETSPTNLDLRLRVKDPDGLEVLSVTYANQSQVDFGKFELPHTIAADDPDFVKWGTYTAHLDWDTDEAFPLERQEVASVTFTVRLTDKPEYGRTDPTSIRAYVTENAIYRYEIFDPTGASVWTSANINMTTAPDFLDVDTWTSAKDTLIGTYTAKVLKADTVWTVVKSQTFDLKAAVLSIAYVAADFKHDDLLIDTDNEDVMRMEIVTANFTVTYPSGAYATAADVPEGFTVSVFHNTTKIADISLDPLLAFDVTENKWMAEWTVPKDAPLGINYAFNATAYAVTDTYGNSGPEEFVSTSLPVAEGGTGYFFEVVIAELDVSDPALVYPGVGAELQRTLEARASFKVTYPDGSLVTADDFESVNATITGPEDYTVVLSAADYSAATGLWIATWKIPYDTPLGDYRFKVEADKVVDRYGNKWVADTGVSDFFTVKEAVLKIENLATDKPSYNTDEELKVSFDGVYPSGDKVTTGEATVKISGPGFEETITATYYTVEKKFVAEWIIPTLPSGTYNATIEVNALEDDAANKGPTVMQWVNFEIVRVGLTDVLAALEEDIAELEKTIGTVGGDVTALSEALDALKADLAALREVAAMKADVEAAKTDIAGVKADVGGVKAAVDAVKTATDALKTAVDALKTDVTAAGEAVAGLTSIVWVAVVLSLIAAIAAIAALGLIYRKIV